MAAKAAAESRLRLACEFEISTQRERLSRTSSIQNAQGRNTCKYYNLALGIPRGEPARARVCCPCALWPVLFRPDPLTSYLQRYRWR